MNDKLQYSDALRSLQLGAIRAALGDAAVLEIRSGTMPLTCQSPDAADGELLCTVELPPSPFSKPFGGKLRKGAEPWEGVVEQQGAGGYFRMRSSGGTVWIQGPISVLNLGQEDFEIGEVVTVEEFAIEAGNA